MSPSQKPRQQNQQVQGKGERSERRGVGSEALIVGRRQFRGVNGRATGRGASLAGVCDRHLFVCDSDSCIEKQTVGSFPTILPWTSRCATYRYLLPQTTRDSELSVHVVVPVVVEIPQC